MGPGFIDACFPGSSLVPRVRWMAVNRVWEGWAAGGDGVLVRFSLLFVV